MALIHINLIPSSYRTAFENKVVEIANFLQVKPEWLMQVMYAESKLNPQAQNRQDGRLIAAGLLQWTSASGEPGAPSSILNKTALQQLDRLKVYFTPYKGKMKSYFDVYLVTFFPAGMGKADDYVFKTSSLSAALIAKQNPAVNINKDAMITMAEFKQYVYNSTPKTVRDIVFGVLKAAQDNAGIILFGIAAAFFF